MTARLRPEVELIVSNAVASTEQLKQENVETVAWTKNVRLYILNVLLVALLMTRHAVHLKLAQYCKYHSTMGVHDSFILF